MVDNEGAITCGGETFDPDNAQPDAGWMSADSMIGGAGQRSLMVGLLKSERLKWVHTGAAGVDHPIWAPAGGQGRAC